MAKNGYIEEAVQLLNQVTNLLDMQDAFNEIIDEASKQGKLTDAISDQLMPFVSRLFQGEGRVLAFVKIGKINEALEFIQSYSAAREKETLLFYLQEISGNDERIEMALRKLWDNRFNQSDK